MLGYRVNSSGDFVNAVGSPLATGALAVYEGLAVLPVSGGSIRAGSFTATANTGSFASTNNAGTITLAGSVYPAGTPTVTSITSTVSNFSDANDQFTITGHGLSTGSRVRFYGVQEGALLPLVDGGLYYVINTGTNTFKLAGTAAEATAGTALALSLASSITTGTLATFSPQVDLGTSAVSLSGGTIAISGNIQTQTLSASASNGDLSVLKEAWLSTGSTSLSTPSNKTLLIDRTRTDLRRAILTTSSLSLPSSGNLTLKGFLDLKPTTAGATPTLSFQGTVTITGELTSSANLSLTTSGALNVSNKGSLEATGDLTLSAASFNLDADAAAHAVRE
jgi:hypothetical protein